MRQQAGRRSSTMGDTFGRIKDNTNNNNNNNNSNNNKNNSCCVVQSKSTL